MTLRTGQKISIETLDVELVESGLLRLGGSLSSATGQSEFRRLLDELHAQLVASKIAVFGVDVRTLNFVNSSAIRVFVDWISKAVQARYKLAFRTDSAVTWHRLSCSVLKSLAPDTVDILDARAAPAPAGGVRT
jgi:hypothetical protein